MPKLPTEGDYGRGTYSRSFFFEVFQVNRDTKGYHKYLPPKGVPYQYGTPLTHLKRTMPLMCFFVNITLIRRIPWCPQRGIPKVPVVPHILSYIIAG